MRRSEKDIRPDNDRELLCSAFKKDFSWFEKNRENFVQGKCPVCQTRVHSDLLPKSLFKGDRENPPYRRCAICKSLFLDHHPSSEGYAQFYSQSEIMRVFSERIYKDSLDNRKELIYAPRLKRMLDAVHNYGRKNGVYLEIGAGSGIFAQMVQNSEYFTDTVVIEPNPCCANDCRELALNVIETTVENVSEFPPNISVCTLFECIANICDPQRLISDISKKLSPGTLLIITTPNCLGFDVLELGSSSSSLGYLYIQLFNPASMRMLLERNSFEIVEMTTPGLLDVDLVRKAYAKADQAQQNNLSNWLRELLLYGDENILDEFQSFLSKNLLSSHLWVVARKK